MKTKSTFFCMLLLVLLCSTAMGQEHFVVKAEWLNVRKVASAKSAVVGVLRKGDTVNVHSFKGSWAEIDYNGGRAFVSKNYIEPSPEPVVEMITPVETETTPAITDNGRLNQSGLAERGNTPNADRGVGGLAMAWGGSGLFERRPTYESSVFTIAIESGSFVSTSPVFYDWGLGLYFSSSHSKSSYYSYDASSWGLRIPLHIGWNIFGDSDDLHLSVRGGIYSNFLFSKKINKEHKKVKFKDRFGFEGGVRTTLGYKWFSVTAEYLFPFQSGVNGAWLFGITLGS